MGAIELWDKYCYYIMGVLAVCFLVFMFIIVPNMGDDFTDHFTYDNEQAVFNKLSLDDQTKYLDMSDSNKIRFISKHLNY